MSCLYLSQGVSLPIGFELFKKTKRVHDAKTGKEKGKASEPRTRSLAR
jgi:hypothetical protein